MGLQMLNLWGPPVEDLSPLANLIGLQRLYLPAAQVQALSPMAKLAALKELVVPRKTIRDAQVAELQRALPQCRIVRE